MADAYTKGLSAKQAARRRAAQKMKSELYKKDPKNPKLYKNLPGDDKKTKPSKYNEGPGAGSLEDIAEKYNAPLSALKSIYNKGLAAWASSGHRPGASQHGWARARVMSVLKGGKARQVDAKEWEAIQEHRKRKGGS